MASIRGEVGGEMHGTIGDVTVATWKGMKVARRKLGPKKGPVTEAQQAQRDQFAFASDYAKEVAADTTKKGVYEALAKGQPTTWRALAVQDYLTPPIVARVDVQDYHGKVGDRLDLFIHDQTVQSVHIRLISPTADQPAPEPGQVPVGDGGGRRRGGASSARPGFTLDLSRDGAAAGIQVFPRRRGTRSPRQCRDDDVGRRGLEARPQVTKIETK